MDVRMDVGDWQIQNKAVKYTGDDPEKLEKKVWQPAHWWAARHYGLHYGPTYPIDCIGEIGGYDIEDWEIKTSISGYHMLRDNQHTVLSELGGGYIFVHIEPGYKYWRIDDVQVAPVGDIEIEEWHQNPERWYRQAWVDPDLK